MASTGDVGVQGTISASKAADAPTSHGPGLGPRQVQAFDEQGDAAIDAANSLSDNDSAFGESSSSYTSSVTSSIWNYQYENGRRYHAFHAGQYVVPNDEKEQDRMDLMYHIYSVILGGRLFLSPLSEYPQRVLDVGTGTGIWAIDFADQFPSAEVIGLDLSPIQPNWVPPNVKFQIDDVEADWTFPPSHSFDFIRLRAMGGSIANWPRLLQQAYDHLLPGGWIEVSDFESWASTDDDSLPENSSYAEYQKRLDEASVIFGKKLSIGAQHKQGLMDAGFHGVVEHIQKVPLSPWAKDPKLRELGRYMQIQMLEAVESYGLALLTRVLGWDAIKTQVLIAGVRQDLRNRNYHMYSRCHTVYGQKPLR